MKKKFISVILLFIIFLCFLNTKSYYKHRAISKNSSTLTVNKNLSMDESNNSSQNLKNLDISKLDRSEKNWFFKPNNRGTPSEEVGGNFTTFE